MIRSEQTVVVSFPTSSFTTGAATDADALPTGTLIVNGANNAAAVTITNVATGRYRASVTLPTLALFDSCEIEISATVGGVAARNIVWRDAKDVLPDVEAGSGGGLPTLVEVPGVGGGTFLLQEVSVMTTSVDEIADAVVAEGNIGADIDAILAKVNLIGTAQGELNAPLTNGSLLTLYKNGDYKLAHNRAIRVTIPAGTYPDITGATCRLGVTKSKDNTGGFVVNASAQSGSAVDDQTIDFELDHATETGDLEPAYSYGWMCRIVKHDGGSDWDNLDPISGKVKVLEDRVGNNAP